MMSSRQLGYRPQQKQKRHLHTVPEHDRDIDMGFSGPFLNVPSAPRRNTGRKNEVDDFLSSELEISFASTMSINSPTRSNVDMSSENLNPDYAPMDISPMPKRMSATKPITRPRAFTNLGRPFGNDVSNVSSESTRPKSISGGKRLQRAALPSEWMMSKPSSPAATEAMDMDIDMSFSPSVSSSVPEFDAPLSAAPTLTAFNIRSAEPGPLSTASTITSFGDLLFKGMAAAPGDSSFEDVSQSPCQPFPKKRRSLSPESKHHVMEESSSPAPSSPSVAKAQRMSSGSMLLAEMKKPMLGGLGAPLALNAYLKRPRRPALSTALASGDSPLGIKSAFPTMTSNGLLRDKENEPTGSRPPPVRRAFSAMVQPAMLEQSMSSEEGSSFDHSIEMSSPAQAYAKRQQLKTLRRRDGTDDFRPLTGAPPLVRYETETTVTGSRRSADGDDRETERNTPRSKYLNGLGSFGDNEAHGKILPCHRVREDGLMRINCKTLDALLDGEYDTQIQKFHVIDCRFDYEYNGGHIPGAININTTAGVEDFLLSGGKPRPSSSGDAGRKTILVFHCEFSAKRAPTFAKHLRSKDRALNNHVYPKVHYPEVYILEGGYCQYFSERSERCQPSGYVTMDDPHHAASRKEDMDHFRKAKFGRTKSYSFGDSKLPIPSQQSQPKRNTAPSGGPTTLFAAAQAARSRRGTVTNNTGLHTLVEDSSILQSDDDEIDLGDSPCPPPTKGVVFKGKKIGRPPFVKSDTYGPTRVALGY